MIVDRVVTLLYGSLRNSCMFKGNFIMTVSFDWKIIT